MGPPQALPNLHNVVESLVLLGTTASAALDDDDGAVQVVLDHPGLGQVQFECTPGVPDKRRGEHEDRHPAAVEVVHYVLYNCDPYLKIFVYLLHVFH